MAIWSTDAPRKLRYVPPSAADDAVHADVRYRLGAWLHGSGTPLGLAYLMAGGLVATPIFWALGIPVSDGGRTDVLFLSMATVSAAAVCTHWYWIRQDRSERRRAYTFWYSPRNTDPAVEQAYAALSDRSGSEDQRCDAVDLLISEGLASPPGSPAPQRPRER